MLSEMVQYLQLLPETFSWKSEQSRANDHNRLISYSEKFSAGQIEKEKLQLKKYKIINKETQLNQLMWQVARCLYTYYFLFIK